MSLAPINLGLKEILSDPLRRQEFFRTITQDDIAAQIRALRKTRGLTQAKFAELAGMKQSAVSRIEQAEYASWTLAILLRAAGALNARWRMILEPCEDAVKEYIGIESGDQEGIQRAAGVHGSALEAAVLSSFTGGVFGNELPKGVDSTQFFPTFPQQDVAGTSLSALLLTGSAADRSVSIPPLPATADREPQYVR